MPSRQPLITLLTDFGSRDTYVGVLKGVIASVCPEAAVVDLTHAVPPQDIRAGAFHLLVACPYFPAGSVHLAVVDPGVGTDRRVVAVEAGGHTFVGPDNGLLRWIVEWLAADSWRAVQLTEPRYWLAPASEVSHTFHGRDIMAPVAAPSRGRCGAGPARQAAGRTGGHALAAADAGGGPPAGRNPTR